MKIEAGSGDRLKINIVPSHLVRFKWSLHLNPLIDSHIYRIVLLVSANNYVRISSNYFSFVNELIGQF